MKKMIVTNSLIKKSGITLPQQNQPPCNRPSPTKPARPCFRQKRRKCARPNEVRPARAKAKGLITHLSLSQLHLTTQQIS